MTANSKQVGGDHYTRQDIQPWEYMQAVMTKDQFEGFILGNIIKYISRYQEKGGKEDLQKASHYLDKLLEIV
jgi:hypothetical protein